MTPMSWICVFRLLHFLYNAMIVVLLAVVARGAWATGTKTGFVFAVLSGVLASVFAQAAAVILREGYTTSRTTNPNLERQKEK